MFRFLACMMLWFCGLGRAGFNLFRKRVAGCRLRIGRTRVWWPGISFSVYRLKFSIVSGFQGFVAWNLEFGAEVWRLWPNSCQSRSRR